MQKSICPNGKHDFPVVSFPLCKRYGAKIIFLHGACGTGKSAIIPGYQVAGKTGTAYIADKNGYSHTRHSASFVGMAPASDPQFVIVVTLRNPQGSSYLDHFGGTVSAPVFQTVMSAALRLYDVAPDGLQKTS